MRAEVTVTKGTISPVQSVELSNGITLQYVEHGQASGVPVLLLHGATDSWHSFELVLPHLPDSVHAFALTLRGHGDSSRPASGYRYADFALDLAAFMDAVGLQSAVIVGHSMGRAIAQRFALDHAERTLGLVLMGAFAGDARNPAVVEVEKTVSTFTDPIDAGFVREFQESTLAQPIPSAFLETVVRESLKVPARVWREVFVGIRDDDVVGELGKIAAPAIVVSGDRDAFGAPTEVVASTAAILGARLLMYHGAGHGLHWEEPARFAADVAAFALSRP